MLRKVNQALCRACKLFCKNKKKQKEKLNIHPPTPYFTDLIFIASKKSSCTLFEKYLIRYFLLLINGAGILIIHMTGARFSKCVGSNSDHSLRLGRESIWGNGLSTKAPSLPLQRIYLCMFFFFLLLFSLIKLDHFQKPIT